MAIKIGGFSNVQVAAPDLRPTSAALGSISDALMRDREIERQTARDALEMSLRQAADSRANEQLQMQRDEVARKEAARVGAQQYQSALTSALSGGVVGQQDQGKIAAEAQRLSRAGVTGADAEAEMNKYLTTNLPSMTSSYGKSPEAQLQVLRGVTTGSKDMDIASRLALLKEAELPLEKAVDRTAALADAKQKADYEMGLQKALLGAKTDAEVANTLFVSGDNQKQVYGSDWLKMSPQERAGYMPIETKVKLASLTTKDSDKNVYTAMVKDEDGTYKVAGSGRKDELLKTNPTALIVDTPIAKEMIDGSGGGGGSGGGAGKKGSPTALTKVIETAKEFDLLGTGDGQRLIENSRAALALGVKPEIVEQLAAEASFKGSGILGDRDANQEFYNKTGLTVTLSDGSKALLGDAIEAAKLKGIDLTKSGTGMKLSNLDLKKSTESVAENNGVLGDVSSTPGILPASKKTTGLEMGSTLEQTVRAADDALVKDWVGLDNNAMVRENLQPLLNRIGPTEFKNRYPQAFEQITKTR